VGREIGLLQEHVGAKVPTIGFYTYGEICPLTRLPDAVHPRHHLRHCPDRGGCVAMIVATGHSEDLDSADAIEEALDRCAETLDGETPQAGLLFAGIDHDHQALLDGVEARYPGVQVIGCTTHGELSPEGFAEDSVALILFHSGRVQFRAGVGEEIRTDPAAARRAASMALEGLDGPVRLCIALPEGCGDLDSPGTIPMRLLDALSAALGPDVLVCGGLAADQTRFTGTYQFCNGRVYSDAMPVLLVAGPLHVSEALAVSDVENAESLDEGLREHLLARGVRSLALQPLRTADRTVGLLELSSLEADAWTRRPCSR
jgi:hypothetical protein